MWERVNIAKQDSDSSLFLALMYLGEAILKTTTLGLIAGIEESGDRNRYRLLHTLVHADGLGDWAKCVDDALTGPASQLLIAPMWLEQTELLSKNGYGTWQYESVNLIHGCVMQVIKNYEKLPFKVDARRWLNLFTLLRNKTRGHGAQLPGEYYAMCEPLESSIKLYVDNFNLFKRPWAHLHRNWSGKYRITKLTNFGSELDYLKTGSPRTSLNEGIYIFCELPIFVELFATDSDVTDFYLPNGSFTQNNFEMLSYITNNKLLRDSTPYLLPTTPLPKSETEGIGVLDVQGKCFGNLPPVQGGYISRDILEKELTHLLQDNNHQIITLSGRGGIGKTWLALKVLHNIADSDRFDIILWFSARDIDLFTEGAKQVKPHLLNQKDIADEFVKLVNPSESADEKFVPVNYLSKVMSESTYGPILYVFDNFETVRNPVELYNWIDTYVRMPSKVLITTRKREFKGDYPIEVLGMTEDESTALIESTSISLKIIDLLTEDYKRDIVSESLGHPYVIKVLLGEVAKAGKLVKVERIVANMDGILDALFERTFNGLTPAAKRVFLTLCSWRSTIPLLALEAVLLRPNNERMDILSATDELQRSSFIELSTSPKDEEQFISVPLVASIFGKKKLITSSYKSAIEADLNLLYAFGASQHSEIKQGINPRIERLFKSIADKIQNSDTVLNDFLPMVEYIASKYAPAWLLLAKLFDEKEDDIDSAKNAIRRYLENTPAKSEFQGEAWKQLARFSRFTSDALGEIHALLEMCKLPDVPFTDVSNTVNRINMILKDFGNTINDDEKRIVTQSLADLMESRLTEADATDCSRLAWLYMRLNDVQKARKIARQGISIEPTNEHCKNIIVKLDGSVQNLV